MSDPSCKLALRIHDEESTYPEISDVAAALDSRLTPLFSVTEVMSSGRTSVLADPTSFSVLRKLSKKHSVAVVALLSTSARRVELSAR